MDTSISSIAITSAYLTLAYLGHKCMRDPNPSQDRKVMANDRIFTNNWLLPARMWITYMIYTCVPVLYAITPIILDFTHNKPSLFCPNPNRVDRNTYFTFTPLSTTVILATAILAMMRLSAYATLGTDFTYMISKPKQGLNKDGLYGYVRHPSYTGGIFHALLLGWYLSLTDGPLGCVLPDAVYENESLAVGLSVLLTIFAPCGWWTVGYRIVDEEKFLKKEFGKEYEEYSKKTARLVPGVY